MAAALHEAQIPHVVIPWSEEMTLMSFRTLQCETEDKRKGQAFPLGDNLLALTFVSLADLTQDQRNTPTSIMTHRGRTHRSVQYTRTT